MAELRQDNPADTFLPGMRLRISYATRAGDRFVSWKGPGDPSPGSLISYRMDPAGTMQQRWRSSAPWTGCMVTTTDFKVNPGGVSCTYLQVNWNVISSSTWDVVGKWPPSSCS
nr:unnamed protein product [Digitaria exilis]